MLVAGRSIGRIAAPYFMLALMLSVFSVYLYGQLQPLARYGYHVAVNQVLQTGWDARVEENHFIDIGQGVTFTADVIEPDGRGLRGVFMERRGSQSEQILTAARGRIVPTPEGLQLKLEDGLVVHENDGKASLSISRFETGFSANDFTPTPTPMEARGASVRERTLAELWRDMHLEGGETKPAAEFHSRLARALIFPFLPLLALPLGMASKRGRRAPGVIFGVLALLAIDHALQLGESLADTGRLPAAAAVWVPYAVFVGLSLWIFRGSLAWPGDNPVLRAVVAVEGLIDRARPRARQSAP
jgi:lipopolysaccharide export system permease protein